MASPWQPDDPPTPNELRIADLEAALRQAQRANAAVLADGGRDPHKWFDEIAAAQRAIAAALRPPKTLIPAPLPDWIGPDTPDRRAQLQKLVELLADTPLEAIPPLRFTYRNHRGDIGVRTVAPLGIRYGSTAWHPEPQWLLRAYDLDKSAEREFAINDINPNEASK